MAVAGMATTNNNTVSSALECTKNKHGVNSAGARNSDDLYVSRICKTVVSCEVSARI